MPKSISIPLKAHLAEPLTTIATCWRVELLDGTTLGFTDHDRDIYISTSSYSGTGGLEPAPGAPTNPLLDLVFKAASGYTATDVANNNNMDVDNLELQGLLVDDSITEEDLVAGRWDGATIIVFQVNWADLSQGIMYMRVGKLGKVSRGRNQWRAELLGLTHKLQSTIVEVTSPGCRATFGDERCKITASSYQSTGLVDSYDPDTMTLFISDRAEADDYWAFGFVRFTSGANYGYVAEIRTYTVGQAVLQTDPPYPLTGGESYLIQRGCGKSLEEWCRDTYNNVVNFRGEPHLMGNDLLIQTGRRRS